MWMNSRIRGPRAFVWEDVVDGSEGEHDEGERGVGRVEAVGPVGDEPHPPVESLVAGVVDPESHGSEDALAPLVDRFGRRDERLEAARLCLRAHQRSRSPPTSASERSPANTARSASGSA